MAGRSRAEGAPPPFSAPSRNRSCALVRLSNCSKEGKYTHQPQKPYKALFVSISNRCHLRCCLSSISPYLWLPILQRQVGFLPRESVGTRHRATFFPGSSPLSSRTRVAAINFFAIPERGGERMGKTGGNYPHSTSKDRKETSRNMVPNFVCIALSRPVPPARNTSGARCLSDAYARR